MGATGAHGSFRLPDVLVAPSMVHNLLSIRRLTADNSCFVEFDSSGLRRLFCQLLSPPLLPPPLGTVASAMLVVML
jgi:hypothetical protein